MKIRDGFVSNSSTSSFVIMCKKDDWNKALSEIGKENKKFVDCLFGRGGTTDFYGEEYVFVTTTSSTEERFYDLMEEDEDGEPDYDIYDEGNEVISDFMKKIRELGGIAREDGC